MRILVVPIFASLVVAPMRAHAQIPPSAPEPPAVVTHGEAIVKRAPDQAWVTFAAEARAPKSGEAQRKAADAMKVLQDALKSAGVAGDAIKTTGYSLQPDMEYVGGTSRLKGYIAHNQIEVRVEPLDKVSAVLDAGGSAGATSISGLRFDLKDHGAVERDALRLAVRDAMARAESIASGAGRSLGGILRIEDQGGAVVPVMQKNFLAVGRAAAEATPITPGEVEIRANVTLTVAIR